VSELPGGTVTLLFTDVEGSTRLLQRIGADRYRDVLTDHHRLLRDVATSEGGHEVDVQGEGFLFAFSRPTDALGAAIRAQRALSSHAWPEDVEVRVRMGIHTGEPTLAAAGYVGLDVHRGARICAAAHGGQVLVSTTTHELVVDAEGISFRDLGEHRLKDLLRAQRLFQVIADGLETSFPPPRALDSRVTNLPLQPTPLIGRDSELAELGVLMASSRLVTLTGPGGIGKTRLALQAAADRLEDYAGGTYFVPLEAVADPTLVLAAVASTVGVREGPGQALPDALVERFSEEPVLLVLDNFEHLLQAAADFSALLIRCDQLKSLTTSREPLRVAVEQEYPVSPLEDDDALALFRERARAARPDFEPTADDEDAIRQVCARVDRLPLALELAAARVKLLPPRELATRLDQRLAVLTGGARDRPSRQQTLRAAIEWSYELLDELERDLFERLAVFAGGWSLPAAEAVCDASLDLLGSLVDKSLVMQAEDVADERRFAMLETLREFALEKVEARADHDDLRRRHGEYFAEAMPDPITQGFGPAERTTTAFKRLRAETDNLRAALSWAAETGSPHELRLATLYQLSPQVGPTECRHVLRESLAHSTVGGVERARALLSLGHAARMQGDPGDAQASFEAALALYRAAGDAGDVIGALSGLVLATIDVGDLDGAKTLVDEAESVALGTGDQRLVARVWSFQAAFPLLRGDFADARTRMERVLTLLEENGDEEGAAYVRSPLALVTLLQGDTWEALRLIEDSLRFFTREVGRPGMIVAMSLTRLAAALAAAGATGPAVRIFAAAEAFRTTREVELAGPLSELHERVIGPVRRVADDPRFSEERAAGEALSFDEAVEYALDVVDRVRGNADGGSPPDA
jgi:predicted ATPase/class 3 adenylate cyclase